MISNHYKLLGDKISNLENYEFYHSHCLLGSLVIVSILLVYLKYLN